MAFVDAMISGSLHSVESNELARRALAGCADSFTELSTRFRPRLIQMVRPRLGGHWADAEDVAQDALARAFQQLGRFDPRYCFSTWLYTIAFRLACDRAREQRRRGGDVGLEAVEYAADHQRPEQLTVQREELGQLWVTAQTCLSPDQFSALWLRFGEDLTIVEIARVMRKTQVGVRVLLHRARTRLLRRLSDHPEEKTASRSSRPALSGAKE